MGRLGHEGLVAAGVDARSSIALSRLGRALVRQALEAGGR